jgi:hypothetical protein
MYMMRILHTPGNSAGKRRPVCTKEKPCDSGTSNAWPPMHAGGSWLSPDLTALFLAGMFNPQTSSFTCRPSTLDNLGNLRYVTQRRFQ